MNPNDNQQTPAPSPAPLPTVQPHAQTPVSTPAPVSAPTPPATPTAAAPAPAPAPTPSPMPAAAPMPTPGSVQGVAGQAAPQPMKPKSVANTTQNALNIAEIRDGIVIMNDGSYRSVIMAKSINFDLMSPEEKEAVEFAYQGFLNSLFFDIQIFLRSSKVDLRPYIEKLDRIRQDHDNMLLALLMEDYIRFINILSQETNIMDKRFYVVVPYFPVISTQVAIKEGKKLFGNLFSAFKQNKARQVITINEADLEKAKTELRNRVQAVMSGLQQVGVQTIALDTEELIELYYDAYNPDTATRQQLRNFSDMTAPIVEKGTGQAENPGMGGV